MTLQDYLFECTVRVETDGTAGTGFFIAPGRVVTAAHLVEDPANSDFPRSGIRIRHRGESLPARVIRYAASPDPDLAVLEIAPMPSQSSAYLYATCGPGDPLYVCGVSGPGEPDQAVTSLIDEWSPTTPVGGVGAKPEISGSAAGGLTLRWRAPMPESVAGAPVLDLRTGGVLAVVTRAVPNRASPVPFGSATSVSVIASLFPDVWLEHDRYHAADPGWFAASGVRGTVFAAREHILATRDTCETPIQPLITPRNGRKPTELLADVVFQSPLESAERGDVDCVGQTRIEAVLDQSQAHGRSLLLVGPTGSGRSSVLRALGFRAASEFGNLGALGQKGTFPILLRANQLATDNGDVERTILNSMEKGNEVMTGMDLPETFLTDLAASPGVRLLLMIDGMDEIQNSRDVAELVGLIGRIQDAPGFGPRSQLLVTARPSAAEHFRYADFDVSEVRPLGGDSIRTAAQRWLGEEAEAFLTANAGLVRSRLLSSPLVLSVALKLYETDPAPLPGQVVALYGRLISNLARERRQELAGKYGAEVGDNAVDLLGFVALELLRSGTVMDETWVRTTAARYFSEYVGLDRSKAATSAESFTHFAAADSHFIGPAGSRFFWSHLSFRDYFAASCLLKLFAADGRALREIRHRWFDPNWGRTPSFALQLLEDETERQAIVEEVMASGRTARFAFMTDLVREGAALPPGVVSRFVAALVARIESERREGPDTAQASVTFDLLTSLAHLREAKEGLEKLGGVGVGGAG